MNNYLIQAKGAGFYLSLATVSCGTKATSLVLCYGGFPVYQLFLLINETCPPRLSGHYLLFLLYLIGVHGFKLTFMGDVLQ